MDQKNSVLCSYALFVLGFCIGCEMRGSERAIAYDSAATTNNLDEWNKLWKVREYKSPASWYSESTSNGVTIQSGFPRGAAYTDATGEKFECRIFWNRIVNGSSSPIEVTLTFPQEPLPIESAPEVYVKMFFPPDTLSAGPNEFGLTEFVTSGMDSLLGPDKPLSLQRTINPYEEFRFYTGIALDQSGGAVRAGIVLKEQRLFYRISIIRQFDDAIFACGRIVVKK